MKKEMKLAALDTFKNALKMYDLLDWSHKGSYQFLFNTIDMF